MRTRRTSWRPSATSEQSSGTGGEGAVEKVRRAAGPGLVHGPAHWIRLRRLPRLGAGIVVGTARFLWLVAELLVPGVRLKHRLCCAVCCIARASLEPCSENVRIVGAVAAGQHVHGPTTDRDDGSGPMSMHGRHVPDRYSTRGGQNRVRGWLWRLAEAAQH